MAWASQDTPLSIRGAKGLEATERRRKIEQGKEAAYKWGKDTRGDQAAPKKDW